MTDKIRSLAESIIKDLTTYEIEQLKALLSVHLKDEHDKIVQGRW